MENNTLTQYEYEVITFAEDVTNEDVLKTYEEILADRKMESYTEGKTLEGGLFIVNHIVVLEGIMEDFVAEENYESAQRTKNCIEKLQS